MRKPDLFWLHLFCWISSSLSFGRVSHTAPNTPFPFLFSLSLWQSPARWSGPPRSTQSSRGPGASGREENPKTVLSPLFKSTWSLGNAGLIAGQGLCKDFLCKTDPHVCSPSSPLPSRAQAFPVLWTTLLQGAYHSQRTPSSRARTRMRQGTQDHGSACLPLKFLNFVCCGGFYIHSI